jgi:hyperosmotically inducible periplasmic protein
VKRKITNIVTGIIVTGGLWSAGGIPLQSDQTAPDNTKANQQDRTAQSPSADQAKNNSSDREVMKQIRREVVQDKSLSSYAHNVKIVSKNGKVTLRGPVQSDQEKQTIEQYAKKYAGDQNVSNELSVKGAAPASK